VQDIDDLRREAKLFGGVLQVQIVVNNVREQLLSDTG
jgi:hypothetical protein